MNIDRNHDFLPDSIQMFPTGGGAGDFIRFFEKELIPYIDKNYKTESYKVLVGHSFGGLFALYALLNQPDLFDAYLAIDPSIWYHEQILIKLAEKQLPELKNRERSIFITGRTGEGLREMGIPSLEELLKASAPKDLNWKIVTYSDEDHGSVTFKSAYDGLRYFFDTGASFRIYPQTGIIPPGKSIYAYIGNINPDLRYTTDGTEPSSASPLCTDKIKIASACTLKIKSVAKKYKNLPSSSFVFTNGNFMNGQKSVENLKPGIKYSCYEGVWDSLPDFSKLNPVKAGISEDIDLKLSVKTDSFALRFEGYIHITKKDIYYFWVMSDDGSKVTLDNKMILANDGLHSADSPKITAVPLEPGYHPIAIDYFDKNGGKALTVGIIRDMNKPSPEPIAKEMLFYRE